MILITGATGYIGRHLVERMTADGQRPRCLVRDISKDKTKLPVDKVELVEGDTTQPHTLMAAVKDVDTIVHTAFITADRKALSSNYYDNTNINGTANLIKAAKEAGVSRIIELSGLGTKPSKPGSYMQGRYLAEKMLIDSGLDYTIVEPSVLFGKGASFIKGLTELIRTTPVLPLIGGGNTMFQPIYVEDVVTVLMKVIEDPSGSSRKTYTIGGPAYYSFSQIYDILLKTMHKDRLKVYAPTPLIGLGAVMMQVLPKPPLTPAAMTLFSFDNTTDLNSVERDFGFTPTSFTDYLAKNGVS